jgi:hypothetical protein
MVSLCYLFTVLLEMCACKETDVRESLNDSTLAGGEGHGSRGETCHLIYRESPVPSVAEHPLKARNFTFLLKNTVNESE